MTADAPKPGRPRMSVTPDNINRVKEILEQDRRVSVMDISEALGISTGSVHNILVEELQLSELCARWIPRLLTPLQKEARVTIAKRNIRLLREAHYNG